MKIKESEYLVILGKLYFVEEGTISEIQKYLGYSYGYNYAYQIIKQMIKDGYLIKSKYPKENEKGQYQPQYKLNKEKLFGLLASSKSFKIFYLIIREEVGRKGAFVPEPFDAEEFRKELNLNSS